jgi:hypothetical protein
MMEGLMVRTFANAIMYPQHNINMKNKKIRQGTNM